MSQHPQVVSDPSFWRRQHVSVFRSFPLVVNNLFCTHRVLILHEYCFVESAVIALPPLIVIIRLVVTMVIYQSGFILPPLVLWMFLMLKCDFLLARM